MLSRLVITGLALASVGGVHAADTSSGEVAGWSGGRVEIRSFDPNGDYLFGRISADGEVVVAPPASVSTTQTVSQTFRCSETPLVIDGGDAKIAPASLFVARDGEEIGSLVAASSEEVARWVLSYGAESASEGYRVQWIYVEGASTVTGECSVPVYLDPEGDTPATQVTEYRLGFRPGWNLVQHGYVETVAAPDGRRHPLRVEMRVLDELPKDVVWVFEPLE